MSFSKFPSIEVIREYNTYNYVNSCVRRVERKIVVFIPKQVSLYVVPFRQYLPDLEIIVKGGEASPILSYKELHRMLGREFTIEEMRKYVSDVYGISQEEADEYNNFAFIALADHPDQFYEIILKWVEQPNELEKGTDDLLTIHTLLPLRFFGNRVGGVYAALKVDDKYEIDTKPIITQVEKQKIGNNIYLNPIPLESKDHVILNDKKHNVVHFHRGFTNEIKIQYKINVPKMLRVWLWFGFAIGIGVVPIASNFHQDQSMYPIILGVIGLLVGFRIMLFHDIELLTRWNVAYLVLITYNIIWLVTLNTNIEFFNF
ncbi:MAG: hypothetical protein ACRD9Q_03400 [Nitrososphaeraceae archaeon]